MKIRLSTKRTMINDSGDIMRRLESPHFTTKIEEKEEDKNNEPT